MTRQGPKTHALRLWLSLAFLLFCAHSARAAPQTYVSAKGNDANTCQQIAPCRTFAGALAKTDIRGEVVVLDSGEYGPFTATFSVSVTAAGVYAGVTIFDADAVTLKPSAGSAIALRGLTLRGFGDSRGIVYHGPEVARAGDDSELSAALHVEGCTLSGFSTAAVRFEGNGELFVKDTTVRNTASVGIHLITSGWQKQHATVVNSRLEKNDYGLYAQGSENSTLGVTARDTVAAGNKGSGGSQGVGFIAYYARMHLQDCVSTDQAWGVNSTHSAHVTIDGCALTYNDTGLWVYAGSIARLSDTTVAHNKLGIHAFDSDIPSADGKVYTYGNNRVTGNTQNTQGTPILVLSQF